eukprot:1379604-Rhodomonas_salina.1
MSKWKKVRGSVQFGNSIRRKLSERCDIHINPFLVEACARLFLAESFSKYRLRYLEVAESLFDYQAPQGSRRSEPTERLSSLNESGNSDEDLDFEDDDISEGAWEAEVQEETAQLPEDDLDGKLVAFLQREPSVQTATSPPPSPPVVAKADVEDLPGPVQEHAERVPTPAASSILQAEVEELPNNADVEQTQTQPGNALDPEQHPPDCPCETCVALRIPTSKQHPQQPAASPGQSTTLSLWLQCLRACSLRCPLLTSRIR